MSDKFHQSCTLNLTIHQAEQQFHSIRNMCAKMAEPAGNIWMRQQHLRGGIQHHYQAGYKLVLKTD
jgi:hypothetical protein